MLLVFLLLFSACDVGNSSTDSALIQDNADNSINGAEECFYSCTPVDSDNCNDSELTNNICYTQTQHCRGNGGNSVNNGPDFTSQPIAGCVVQGSIPQEEETPDNGFPIQQF